MNELQLPAVLRELRAARLRLAMRHDAFLARYQQEKYKLHVRRPWMALGYRADVCQRLLEGNYGRVSDANPPAVAAEMASQIYDAKVFLWTTRLTQAFIESTEHPPTKIGIPRLRFPFEFFCFEKAWASPVPGAKPNYYRWLLLAEEVNGLSAVVGTCDERAGDPGILVMHLESESVFPTDYPYGKGRFPVDLVLSTLAFLRSRYVRVVSAKQSAPGWDKTGVIQAPQPDQEVSVVTLRHPTLMDQESDSMGRRKYKHQWWVGGHYRNQFYPSEAAHRSVWIAPYVKGPLGAPILPRVYSVVQ